MQETKIGVLGGGQLGRMLVEASIPLALNINILDENLDYPAAGICTAFYEGDFTNFEDVLQFGLVNDVITIEIESVNIEALKVLQQQGKKVFPQPEIIEIIADKGLQKQFYSKYNIPTSEYRLYQNKTELLAAIDEGKLRFPFVQKLRTGGYDGRGVSVINDKNDLQLVFDAPSIVESKVKINKELAIIAARGRDGEVRLFPMVEMAFHPTANLVEYLFSPAKTNPKIEEEAKEIVKHLVNSLQVIGLLAVELFLDENNKILVNEIAPRPHNSGHHTIEACITSQFEQLLRILLEVSLGDTTLIMPSVMINVLGEEGYSGNVHYEGIKEVMVLDGVYVHLYNKKTTKPNRKMGHVTILDKELDHAIDKAMLVKNKFKSKTKNR